MHAHYRRMCHLHRRDLTCCVWLDVLVTTQIGAPLAATAEGRDRALIVAAGSSIAMQPQVGKRGQGAGSSSSSGTACQQRHQKAQ